MYVCLACLPFLSIHHTYTVWSAFTILVWSTKTRTRCVLASLSFQRSPLFKTLQPVECPLHFSVRIQHNGITVLLVAEELCVSFSEAVWRTFSLQTLVWWSQANAGSSGRQLFLNPLWSLMLTESVWVLLELHCSFCPAYVWSLDEKVPSVFTKWRHTHRHTQT